MQGAAQQAMAEGYERLQGQSGMVGRLRSHGRLPVGHGAKRKGATASP